MFEEVSANRVAPLSGVKFFEDQRLRFENGNGDILVFIEREGRKLGRRIGMNTVIRSQIVAMAQNASGWATAFTTANLFSQEASWYAARELVS